MLLRQNNNTTYIIGWQLSARSATLFLNKSYDIAIIVIYFTISRAGFKCT